MTMITISVTNEALGDEMTKDLVTTAQLHSRQVSVQYQLSILHTSSSISIPNPKATYVALYKPLFYSNDKKPTYQ